MCVYVWYCSPWDCSLICDPCSPLASLLHSIFLRNFFLLSVATVRIVTMWPMCPCHKTHLCRYILQKTYIPALLLAEFGGHFQGIQTTKCKQQTAMQCKQQRFKHLVRQCSIKYNRIQRGMGRQVEYRDNRWNLALMFEKFTWLLS